MVGDGQREPLGFLLARGFAETMRMHWQVLDNERLGYRLTATEIRLVRTLKPAVRPAG